MKEQLISWKTAKLANEKGFYKKTSKRYIFRYAEHENDDYVASLTNDPLICDIPAPTQSLLQKWLREKHDIYVSSYIDPFAGDFWNTIVVFKYGMDVASINKDSETNFNSYEEALEKGLQESLKLIQHETLKQIEK